MTNMNIEQTKIEQIFTIKKNKKKIKRCMYEEVRKKKSRSIRKRDVDRARGNDGEKSRCRYARERRRR